MLRKNHGFRIRQSEYVIITLQIIPSLSSFIANLPKENILFGAEFNEDRYNQVIYQCGLEQDLKLFDAGDATEVGEKGLTLSGGES